VSDKLTRPLITTAIAALVFYAGYRTGSSSSPSPRPTDSAPTPAPPQSAAPATPPQDLQSLVPLVVAQAARLDDAAFSEVIKGATGHYILPLDPQQSIDREILDAIRETMYETLSQMNAPDSPVRGLSRINEASRFFEDAMGELLNDLQGFSCAVPRNAEGASQRSDYPDLRLVHEASGRVAYIDPKLFEAKSKNSSLRTFYFEPKTRTNKILDDAHHLLVGISHDGNDGAWKFLQWHVVDLSHFQVGFKAEFQAGNKDLYRPNLIVISGGED
jgi:hypothetical protein